MNHLDFILWVVLFPLCSSISKYYIAKTKLLQNKDFIYEKYNNGIELTINYIRLIFYIFIAYKLY